MAICSCSYSYNIPCFSKLTNAGHAFNIAAVPAIASRFISWLIDDPINQILEGDYLFRILPEALHL